MRFIRTMILIAIGGLLVLACGDKQEPFAPNLIIREYPETEPILPLPEFLRWNGEAPLATLTASFRPVRGQASHLDIYFSGSGGRFLRLQLDAESLRWRPDGTPIAPGESIVIRATVDPVLMMVTFDPRGLVFNSAEPPYLEVSYGAVSASDMTRASEIGLWVQHMPDEPWYRVKSAQVQATHQLTIQANLIGFTRYALAIGR